ncbi:DUF1421 domain-containing protein [Pycnococcus provasolii]
MNARDAMALQTASALDNLAALSLGGAAAAAANNNNNNNNNNANNATALPPNQAAASASDFVLAMQPTTAGLGTQQHTPTQNTIPVAVTPAPAVAAVPAKPAGNAQSAPVPPALRAACEEAMEHATRRLTTVLAPLFETMVTRIGALEEKVDALTASQEAFKEKQGDLADAVNDAISTKLSTLESATREVMRTLQLLRDKAELSEAQQELTRAATEAAKTISEFNKGADAPTTAVTSQDAPAADKAAAAAAAAIAAPAVAAVQEQQPTPPPHHQPPPAYGAPAASPPPPTAAAPTAAAATAASAAATTAAAAACAWRVRCASATPSSSRRVRCASAATSPSSRRISPATTTTATTTAATATANLAFVVRIAVYAVHAIPASSTTASNIIFVGKCIRLTPAKL